MTAMDSVFRLLLRFLLIPVGVLAAILTGTAVILFGQWRIGAIADQALEPEAFIAVVQALFTGTFLITFLVCVMWLVALVGVLFSETFAVRSWMFHAGNGAVSAFIGARLFPSVSGETAPLAEPLYLLAAGLAGGLIYWLIAGWSAGFWKPMRPSAPLHRTPLPNDLPPAT